MTNPSHSAPTSKCQQHGPCGQLGTRKDCSGRQPATLANMAADPFPRLENCRAGRKETLTRRVSS